MEEKIIKVNLPHTNTAVLGQSEQPVDVDLTLPEYYPDIERILTCTVKPYIFEKSIKQNSASAQGVITLTVIYVDTDGMLNSYEYEYPFSKTFEGEKITDAVCFCASAQTGYMNCRAVTPRKIDIHGAITVSAEVSEITAKEIVTDVEYEGIEVKKETIEATVPLGCKEKYIEVEEEIEIGAGAKDINCIIRYDGQAGISDCKIMANKWSYRGDLAVNLLYCNEEGVISSIKEVFPLSGMIEAGEQDNDCQSRVTADIVYLEIKPKVKSEGALRSFSVSAKILITVDTYCKNEIEAAKDAFSKKYDTEIETEETVFETLVANVNDNFITKGTLDFAESQIAEVIDMWCNTELLSTEVNGGILKVNGKVKVSLIAAPAGGEPQFYEREIPFEESKNIGVDEQDLVCTPLLSCIGCNYTLLSNGGLEIRCEINLNAAVFRCKTYELLKSVKVVTEKPQKEKCKYAMIIYFGNKNEKVWDIAKRYLSSVEEIKRINELETEELTEDKMLLIPVN